MDLTRDISLENTFEGAVAKTPPTPTIDPVVKTEEPNTNISADGTVDYSGLALSAFGDLELTGYLNDVKMQNIFNEYEKNIATLSKGEQDSLQDAYYMKEMSKKYLGEYASNIGIGDVSGNLLDIYSAYQQNKSAIKGNYDALELNLNKEYQLEKLKNFEDKMTNQYNIEVAKLDVKTQETIFNTLSGNYDTNLYSNEFQYLESMKDTMNILDYQNAYMALKDMKVAEVETNITNGYFGEFDNATDYINSFSDIFTGSDNSRLNALAGVISNEQTAYEIDTNFIKQDWQGFNDGWEYLDSIASQLDPAQKQQYELDLINQTTNEISNAISNQDFGEYGDIDTYLAKYESRLGKTITDNLKASDEEMKSYIGTANKTSITTEFNEDGTPNEAFIGRNYDYTLYVPGENVGQDSYQYQDSEGLNHFTVRESYGADAKYDISPEDIRTGYEEAFGTKPVQFGDQITIDAENLSTGEYESTLYTYTGKSWHRTVTSKTYDSKEMSSWALSGNAERGTVDEVDGGYFKVSDNNKTGALRIKKADTITLGNVEYKAHMGDSYFAVEQGTRKVGAQLYDQGLVDLFKETHGTGNGIKDASFVLYNGKMYYHYNGTIYTTEKTTKK